MGLMSGGLDAPAAPPVDDVFYADDVGLEMGDRVRSLQFGAGEVVDVDGMAVTVQFDDGNTKKLNVEFARLEKI